MYYYTNIIKNMNIIIYLFCMLVFPSSPIPLAQLDILLLKLPGGGAMFLMASINFSHTLQYKETRH